MNVAASLRHVYASPLGAYLPVSDSRGYADAESLAHCDDGPPTPDLGPVEQSGWRLEGASSFGIRLFAIPLSLFPDLPPTCIDIAIPDQTQWSPELWAKLDASKSMHMMDGRFNQLGIAKHVLRVLGHWSNSTPDFRKKYLDLPFASTIVIKEIVAEVDCNQVRFSSNTRLPKLLLSCDELREMWGLSKSEIPPVIKLEQMRFIERKAPGVALVEMKDPKLPGQYIFKSRATGPAPIYHELKQLLHQKPHPNVIIAPLFLATIRPEGSETDKVCGLILKYYQGHSFEKALPMLASSNSLVLRNQLSWTKDITKGLIHLQNSPMKFVSDLKMDNVLLSTVDGVERAILIDFEQGRNIFSWAPPEIYQLEWLSQVADSSAVDRSIASKYTALLQQYYMPRGANYSSRHQSGVYDNPPLGWYLPWITSTDAEREAGMVFELGKAIWSIFEGVGIINNVLRVSKPGQTLQEFPEFIKTPVVVQGLIKKCTAGSREWLDSDGPLGLYRKGSKIYPRGRAGLEGEITATAEETKEAIRKVWLGEMEKSEEFLRARMRRDQGAATPDDARYLLYLERPKLQEVLEELEKISI